ncbi:MAG: OmpP1/FadL family transporter [Candidatus Eiseniibacteriota bacterium]
MRRVVPLWIGLLLVPSTLHAQSSVTGTPVLPNYERIPVGEREALEAGAYIARTNDANANWYNPAGLVLAERTAANLSASAYEATTLEIASIHQKSENLRLTPIGGFFGLAIASPLTSSPNLRFGFYIARPIAWQTGTIDIKADVDPRTTLETTSEATLSRTQPGLAVGIRLSEGFRIGGSLGVSITDLDVAQDISALVLDADSATTARRTLAVDGTALHLIPEVGLQWDAGTRWHLGLVAAAPGLQMSGSADVSLSNGLFATEDRFSELNFRDEDADFEYRIPFTTGLGIAYTYGRGSIEGTLRYYGSAGPNDLLTFQNTGQLVEQVGPGPPTVTSVSAPPVVNEWREVFNFAIGGNYALSQTLRLHLGVNTDNSPTASADNRVFRKLDLLGGTLGISYTGPSFGGSLGFGYSSGESDPVEHAAGLPTGSLETRLHVSTFRAMYAFSARF